MSQNRTGSGGGIGFIRPSDWDEQSSSIKPAETAEKKSVVKHAEKPKKTAPNQKPTKPLKPSFESTLEPWEKDPHFKPEAAFSLQYLMWWLYTRMRLRKFEFIPLPNTVMSTVKEIRENIQYMLKNRAALNAIIVVLAAKGGSAKTTIIQWLAAFIGYYVRLKPALLGMDVGADKTASRFAIDEDKLFNVTNLLELVRAKIPFKADWLENYTETDEESGLVLFKAKAEDSGTRDFGTNETLAMMRYMHELYPLLFSDTGPGLNMRASDGAAQSANVALVCNKGLSKEVLNDIRKTIALSNYGLTEKKIKPIVVISGVLPLQLNTRTQYHVAEQCQVDPMNVILLPYDRYLDDQKRYNLKRVHISALSLRTTLMLSRLAKRVVEVLVESKPVHVQTPEQATQKLIRTFTHEQRIENVS